MKVLVDGVTEAGTHVKVLEGDGGYLERFTVYIDDIQTPYSNASRRRDGGTTKIVTDRGLIFAYRAFGRTHNTWFDGERLTERPRLEAV